MNEEDEEMIAEAKRMTTVEHITAIPGTRELLEQFAQPMTDADPAAVFVALAVMLGSNFADVTMSETASMVPVETRMRLFTVIVMKAYEEAYRFATEQGQGPKAQ